MVMLKKPTQDALRGVYSLVPTQDFSKPWNDERLYKQYGLTNNEIKFIESLIRPMELEDE
jgi:site-specific DNA-methyltransferase (adenine-specific)